MLRQPGTAEDFEVRELTRSDVPLWYHVYCTREYPSTCADTFAQGWGNTRFAPIDAADGTAVHTYYAASTPEAAYMESVLHDVCLAPAGVFELASLQHYHLAQLRLLSPLTVKALPGRDVTKPAAKQHRLRNRWARPQVFSGESDGGVPRT